MSDDELEVASATDIAEEQVVTYTAPASPFPIAIPFTTPLSCARVFPEGGLATGVSILDETGRFSLLGAGLGRVVGELGAIDPSGDLSWVATEARKYIVEEAS